MGRGKLNMELIANEKSRMTTYHKRKKGLLKKVQEFHILCDVDASIIIYGPQFNNRPVDREIWPNDDSEMTRIIRRYRDQSNDRKKIQDLSDFFVTRKRKIADDVSRTRKAIKGAQYPSWDARLDLLQFRELCLLVGALDSRIKCTTASILKKRGESNNFLGHFQVNPMASTFANALVQKNFELEAYNNNVCMNQYNHHRLHDRSSLSLHDQILPGVLDVNPLNSSPSMWMMMMGNDGNGSGGGESSSIRACNVVKEEQQRSTYFDQPVTSQNQNMMVGGNMTVFDSASYGGLDRQHLPMLPYSQQDSMLIPNHLPALPFSDFCNMDEFDMRDNLGIKF
ncbi:agamous-like MADS-box protein AGL82 [Mercurialis annua]|uniref:agamous-like MADS-box protein AGL82 n=1 Tax=Mercurialis annua TaxID=3986 RepID=UPI00215FF5AE|nr:agamous-like MADS-box protein AGL82 [Mercurialis annua]